MFSTVSFAPLTLLPTEKHSMAGSEPTALKKLKGAALGPVFPSVVTSAIGRGVTVPTSSLYCSSWVSLDASKSDMVVPGVKVRLFGLNVGGFDQLRILHDFAPVIGREFRRRAADRIRAVMGHVID